jgi:hypothetical protein
MCGECHLRQSSSTQSTILRCAVIDEYVVFFLIRFQVKTLFSNMMLGTASIDDGDRSVEESTSQTTSNPIAPREDKDIDSDDDDYAAYLERKNKKLAEAKAAQKKLEDEERAAAKALEEKEAMELEAAALARAATPGDHREQTPQRFAERSMFARVVESHVDDEDDSISRISDVDGLESMYGSRPPHGDRSSTPDFKGLPVDAMEGFDEGIPNPESYGAILSRGMTPAASLPNSRGTVYFNDDEDGMMAARRTPLEQHNHENVVELVDQGLHSSDDRSEEAQPQDDNQSLQSKESADSWDFPTALRMDIFPFSSLVCLPHFISHSDGWGKPIFHAQFSNFSRHWKLSIFWVDEDGALVPRGEVALGDHHFELVATDHVWVVVATLMTKKKTNHQIVDVEDSSKSPALFAFRPSIASLHKNKCTSVVWSPFKSASITQRLYSQKISDSKIPNLKGTIIGGSQSTPVVAAEVKPQIHLQMFDGDSTAAAQIAALVENGAMPQIDDDIGGEDSPPITSNNQHFYAADAKKAGPSTYAKKTHRLPQWPPRRNTTSQKNTLATTATTTGSIRNTTGVAATSVGDPGGSQRLSRK